MTDEQQVPHSLFHSSMREWKLPHNLTSMPFCGHLHFLFHDKLKHCIQSFAAGRAFVRGLGLASLATRSYVTCPSSARADRGVQTASGQLRITTILKGTTIATYCDHFLNYGYSKSFVLLRAQSTIPTPGHKFHRDVCNKQRSS